MEKMILNSMLRNAALCLIAGGALVACGGSDSQGPVTNEAQLRADGEACNPAWVSTTAYVGGNKVSYSGRNYTAAYWTQNNNPSTSSGPSGSGQPWIPGFLCGGTTTTTKATTTTTKAATTTTATGTTTTTKATTTTTKAGTTSTAATTTTTKATTTTTTGTSSCTAPQWNSTSIYNSGGQAVYHNYLWKAAYWTQNNAPEPGGSGPWTLIGYCGALPGAAAGRMFAPYVDVTMNYPLAANAASVGNHYTLAFIIDSGSCTASWAGTIPLSSNLYLSDVNSIRAAGGDVVISFGGAAGAELATTCGSAAALQAQYQAVITKYSLKHMDLDVEGGAIGNTTTNAMRNTVLAALQKANPGLTVSFTLPGLPSGVTSQSMTLLQDAVAKGVNIRAVNIMAMDYGGSYDNGGQMGLSAIYAGWSVMAQLETLYPTLNHAQIAAKVGVTPMIGQNDNPAEVFTLNDASNLVSSARQNGIGFLSYWSATRDKPCAAGTPAVPAQGDCSGISMSTGAFGNIFKNF